MPIQDYNASAALNLLLGTIPVGPGMEREKVNNAFQQLMADVAVFAGPTGGTSVMTYQQAGTGVVTTTGQERMRREVWAEDFMILPAAGDQTLAFQAAIDSLPVGGGTVRFRGDYTIGTINPIRLPAEPKVTYLLGEGRSFLRQGVANAPMIAKVAGVSRIIGAHIKGFVLVAHINSSKATTTNILINFAGFDWAEIDVEYQSNAVSTATDGRAYAVIAGHANGIPCYNNKIRLKMAQTAGPAKGVWLHNNGGSALNNANVNTVTIWTYALGSCDIAVDAADSTQTLVHDSLFEDCPGMVGVAAGNFTKTRDNWFELVGKAINYGQTASTTANNCVSEHDQFSGTNTVVIHSGVAAPPRFEAPLFGAMTFENQTAVASVNYIMPTIARAQPASPGFAFIVGTGTIGSSASSYRHRLDHHGITTFFADLAITTPSLGRMVFQITPPAGYEIEAGSVGVEEGTASVRTVALSTDSAGRNYVWYNPNANALTLCLRVTMRAV